jgi:protein subunit release factor A
MDLTIEVYPYRFGKGGQTVGSGPTGVKVTHNPTGIFAMCDGHRSQHKNKQTALAMIEYGLSDLGWKEKT